MSFKFSTGNDGLISTKPKFEIYNMETIKRQFKNT
jgi:hypothetical protein